MWLQQCFGHWAVVKRELSRKVKLSIYQSIYVDANRMGYKRLKWFPFCRGGWDHVERSQLRWSGHLIRKLPGPLHLEVFMSTANWEERSGPTQNAPGGLHISYGLGTTSGSPQEQMGRQD